MPTQLQLDFTSAASGRTQVELLRDYLLAHPHTWIPMPTLAAEIHAYAVHSRIADLRRAHHMTIQWEGRREPGSRRVLSYYRYLPTGSNYGA